jgi:endonuclease YncB( thermonuclease family)
MARKTPSRSSANNILFVVVMIGLAVWIFFNYSSDPTDPTTAPIRSTATTGISGVRGTAVPVTATTRPIRGTAVPLPTEAESEVSPTRPVRGTAVPPSSDTGATNYPLMPLGLETGRVIDVVDGDTMDVQLSSRVERVRLIGLNTPESVDPRRGVQCFGVEASAFTKGIALDQTVYLESDDSQGDRDQFDRLLRYVWLEDGRLVNFEVISGGYGAQYTFDTPYLYRDIFVAAERTARDSDVGLWSPQTCDGDFDAPADFAATGDGCAEGCINPPAGCTVKGNVNRAGRMIYHEVGVSDAYESVNMNPGEGDRWFCSAAEAEAAGFVAP